MKFLRVTAPYVVLKVKDGNGVFVVQGVYKGARFPAADVDPESLAHHVDNDMAELFSEAAPDPEPEPEPVKADEPKKAAAKKTAA